MDTTGRLLGIAHFRFHEGMADEFERLSRRCLEVVRTHDRGTLRYEVYVDADRTGAVVIEEYADEQALQEHGEHIGEELSAAVLATGEVHGELLGPLSPAMREALADGPVRAFAPLLSLESSGR